MLAKLPAPVKGLSSLIEPLYAPGHVLMDDDLTAGVLYTRNLSRLLFRSLFGCGVICGYGVLPTVECSRLRITVLCGVALDCSGDPVEMRRSETLWIGDACGEKLPDELWVVIRRAQHACAPRELACPSDDDDACGCHATRSRAGYELKVLDRRPPCACGCVGQPPTPQKPPAGARNPQPPAPAAPPANPILRSLDPVDRSRLNVLALDRNQARERLSALQNSLVTTSAAAAAAERSSAQAAADLKAFQQKPKPAQGDAEALKAWTAEQDRLTSAAKAAEAAKAKLSRAAAALTSQVADAQKTATSAETDWQDATRNAAPEDARFINRLEFDPTRLIANTDCNDDHYRGVCGCCCEGDCDGWVVLAVVRPPADLNDPKAAPPTVDYTVRRFIRPVLAADPYWTDPPASEDDAG